MSKSIVNSIPIFILLSLASPAVVGAGQLRSPKMRSEGSLASMKPKIADIQHITLLVAPKDIATRKRVTASDLEKISCRYNIADDKLIIQSISDAVFSGEETSLNPRGLDLRFGIFIYTKMSPPIIAYLEQLHRPEGILGEVNGGRYLYAPSIPELLRTFQSAKYLDRANSAYYC